MKSDDIRERVISIKSREGKNKEREEKKKTFISKIDRFSFEAVSRGTHTPQIAKSRNPFSFTILIPRIRETNIFFL